MNWPALVAVVGGALLVFGALALGVALLMLRRERGAVHRTEVADAVGEFACGCILAGVALLLAATVWIAVAALAGAFA